MSAPLVLPALEDGEVVASAITRAARRLVEGRLVAVPTETVYGLAARADDPRAVERIYAAKGRPAHNPLIVHLPDADAARAVAADWTDTAEALARACWPGPLTLVVRRGDEALAAVSAGRHTIALRVPDHPVLLALLHATRLPLAAPSANRSNAVSPTRADHVVASLGSRVDLVLDAGPCRVGIESSVVDVTTDPPRLLRPGGLSIADLRAVAPWLATEVDASATAGGHTSPGLDRRHYSPRARLRLVSRAELEALDDPAIGTLSLAPLARRKGWNRHLGDDPRAAARALYEALHAADAEGLDQLWIEDPAADPLWSAVRDRLSRASHRS